MPRRAIEVVLLAILAGYLLLKSYQEVGFWSGLVLPILAGTVLFLIVLIIVEVTTRTK